MTLEDNDYGFFHECSCYLILKVHDDRSTSLHYWIGQHAPQQDIKIVEKMSRQLDEVIQQGSVMSREVQCHESLCFLCHFPDGVVYVEGKPKMTVARASKYAKRLYVIRGRTFVSATCTEPCVEVLDTTCAALLDGFPRMYLWVGARCDPVSRVKAVQVARRMRNWQRKGKAHIVVVEESDSAQNSAFLKKLRCGEPQTEDGVTNGLSHSEHDNQTAVLNLHRVSGDRVLYDMPHAASQPLLQRYLVSTDTYLLDQGSKTPLFIWVGAKANSGDVLDALNRGKRFAEHRGYPPWLPVCRITEGSEPLLFKLVFLEWRERALSRAQLARSYSVANIGRALFSRSDPRTVAKLSELWSDDIAFPDDGTTETFRVEGDSLEPPWNQQSGVFLNSDCYVIWHRPDPDCSKTQLLANVLFYWLGSKSTEDRQRSALSLTLTMAGALKQCLVIRVLDNQEPESFLSIFHHSIVVYDQDLLAAGSNVTLYCVRECAKASMRVQQVPAETSSLNSSAAFILMTPERCVLWYGKLTGGLEREFAKTMLAFLDADRMYDYEIVMEGREPDTLWDVLGPRLSYEERFPQANIHRRLPRLSLCCCSPGGVEFSHIHDFEQEDLCESDVFIFDTFNQIYFWCGRAVSVESRQQLIPDYLKEYMSRDPAGRKEAEVDVWILHQDAEPEAFRRYFHCWDPHGFGGEEAFCLARKRVRQENARIDVDGQMVDLTYVRMPRFPYRALLKPELPADVLPDHREHHLSDKQFGEAVKMSRYEFYRLPEWKQAQVLRSARLAHSTHHDDDDSTSKQRRRVATAP